MNRPRGKESTEVRKSQIKGKESENSYQELKRSQKDRHTQNTWKLYRDISTGTAVFLNRKRKTAVPVEISRYSFCVFVCACPSVISSIPGKRFHFPFP